MIRTKYERNMLEFDFFSKSRKLFSQYLSTSITKNRLKTCHQNHSWVPQCWLLTLPQTRCDYPCSSQILVDFMEWIFHSVLMQPAHAARAASMSLLNYRPLKAINLSGFYLNGCTVLYKGCWKLRRTSFSVTFFILSPTGTAMPSAAVAPLRTFWNFNALLWFEVLRPDDWLCANGEVTCNLLGVNGDVTCNLLKEVFLAREGAWPPNSAGLNQVLNMKWWTLLLPVLQSSWDT